MGQEARNQGEKTTMRLGRVIVRSKSYSTVHGNINGSFYREYLVDLRDMEMVDQYREYASQQAWDYAIKKAMEDMEHYGCSAYPEHKCKVWLTEDRTKSRLKYDEQSLEKSKNRIKKILDEEREHEESYGVGYTPENAPV